MDILFCVHKKGTDNQIAARTGSLYAAIMCYLAVSPLFAQSSYLRLVQQSFSVGRATEKAYSFFVKNGYCRPKGVFSAVIVGSAAGKQGGLCKRDAYLLTMVQNIVSSLIVFFGAG